MFDAPPSADNLLDDILSSPSLPLSSLVPQKEKKTLNVYNKNGLNIRFEYKETEPCCTNVITFFSNSNPKEAMGLDFKVAAAKGVELTLFKASATSVPPQSTDAVTQKFKIKTSQPKISPNDQTPIKFKLICKIGEKVLDETGTVKL